MKTTVFCCLRTTSDSKGRTMHVRAKLTLDLAHPGEFKLYIFPGSEHHSCNHAPTCQNADEFVDLFADVFKFANADRFFVI